MNLEEHYYFRSEDYDPNGQHLKNPNELFHHMITDCLERFYERHGKLFHPTSVVLSGLSMKKLERSEQMNEDYYYGIITVNGQVNEEYNRAIARKELRENVVALSSGIPGFDDEPVFLYIDEELDNNTVIVGYSSDNDDDGERKQTPVDVLNNID